MSYILFYFLLVNSCQFMQFHVTCCCKPRPLFMRLVNLTYQLLHYIYILFWTGFFLAMFSVSETLEDAIHFFEGAVTRMTILGSHVTDQIPSPKFRSRLYRRSLSQCSCHWFSDNTFGVKLDLVCHVSFTLHIASTLYLPNSLWFLESWIKNPGNPLKFHAV